MSTTTTAAPAKFTLSRAERDAIHEHLHLHLDADPAPLDRCGLIEHARRVEVRIAYCDALGWDDEGDRDEYPLPDLPRQEILAHLQGWAEASAGCVHDAVANIDRDVARDPEYVEGTTAGESLRCGAKLAHADLLTAAALMDVLDRLDAEGQA